jgi:hypothetical protein
MKDFKLAGGAKPRLTSGGEAVTEDQLTRKVEPRLTSGGEAVTEDQLTRKVEPRLTSGGAAEASGTSFSNPLPNFRNLNQGHSPRNNLASYRRGEAPPHISRRSRSPRGASSNSDGTCLFNCWQLFNV